MNQVLKQKHQFQKEIAQIKENTELYDLKSYAVKGCLIIGTVPEAEDQRESLELFRGNSKNVEIVTYDELLQKLEDVRTCLVSDESETSQARTPTANGAEHIEVPF